MAKKKTKKSSKSDLYYGWNSSKEQVCKIDRVNNEQVSEFQKTGVSDFQVGDWFIIFDHQGKIQILGPFKSSQAAFDHCIQNLDIEMISNDLNADPYFTFGND